ncbi:hypothetical protein GLYMA_16G108950v4 [Glycine max]|nr:hypothetical protein GLYMA_16G108950v4 [Glycine max]KAH1150939.1 hypothetical protein GYH30_044774 [Glycine max]
MRKIIHIFNIIFLYSTLSLRQRWSRLSQQVKAVRRCSPQAQHDLFFCKK